ncbi:phosphocholine-specific phospholipase C [Nocardia tengchongensis]
MSPLNRRRFLGASAAAAAGVVATGGLPPAVAGAASGTIADVKHVVILMQENRSFDHYFGTLKGVRGFGDRGTILLSGGNSVFNQPNGGGRQYPWALSGAGGAAAQTAAQCDGDLPHAWSDQHAAWNNGRLDAWVSAKGSVRTMGYLTRNDIPFHYALADNWTICDSYFCSVLSATGPNRTYHWSGWIDPAGTAGGPASDGGDESGLRWQTYAEALQNAGISWKVYQNAADNYGDNALAYFQQFTSAAPGSPLAVNGMGSVPKATGKTPDDIVAAMKADVIAGTLPQVSWVVPDQGSSEHPDAPPNDGAHFVHNVINAINADPNVFNSTVLILNYDENDGLFDHVPPPIAPGGTADEFINGVPVGLGFRVPLIVISPWTRGGWVSSEVFDHTSVLRFLETWTTALGKKATCPNISAWRRSVCGDLTGVFNFAAPVTGLPTLPDTSTVIGAAKCSTQKTPSPTTNALPAQESGTRPARALPYQPNAYLDHYTFGTNGEARAWINFANTGTPATRAAHFAVYANAFRGGGPWQYTVPAGGTAGDFYEVGTGYGNGAYDLTVVGPNRFLRRFQGNVTTAGKTVQVTSSYSNAPNTGKQAIWFAMTNSGTASVTFTITSNHYRTDGPWTYAVAAGKTVSDYFNAIAYNNGWYDFTVTVSSDKSWSQRFTGHIEIGSPSVSG